MCARAWETAWDAPGWRRPSVLGHLLFDITVPIGAGIVAIAVAVAGLLVVRCGAVRRYRGQRRQGGQLDRGIAAMALLRVGSHGRARRGRGYFLANGRQLVFEGRRGRRLEGWQVEGLQYRRSTKGIAGLGPWED